MKPNQIFHVVLFAICALAISVSVLIAQSDGVPVVHIQGDTIEDAIRIDYIDDAIHFIFDPSITFYDGIHCPLSQICN